MHGNSPPSNIRAHPKPPYSSFIWKYMSELSRWAYSNTAVSPVWPFVCTCKNPPDTTHHNNKYALHPLCTAASIRVSPCTCTARASVAARPCTGFDQKTNSCEYRGASQCVIDIKTHSLKHQNNFVLVGVAVHAVMQRDATNHRCTTLATETNPIVGL